VRLAPGAPLAVALAFDEARPPEPVARLAMAGRLAQLEWSAPAIAAARRISPIHYPPEPGLHAARGADFEGLHGFLADSLPDSWGQLVMRRRLAGLGVRMEDLGPLDRLALVGARGRGALTFQPATTPPDDAGGLDLDALAAASMAVLVGEDSGLAGVLADLGGASGGARPKLHVGFDSSGAVSVSDGEAAAGHEAWIVKFRAPADPIDIGPIEAAYADMARAAGLEMSPHRLIPARRGAPWFAARRFDRPRPGLRLHMVSLAGAVEAPANAPTIGYDMFLRATLAITRRADDIAAAFRRMVFNVLARNRDDHTRQHAYLMDPVGDWRLAPAYDLTPSAGPGGEHYLDIEGEGRNPTRAHVVALGRRHGLSEPAIEAVIEQVRAAVARWPVLAAAAGVARGSRRSVTEAHAAVWERFDGR